MHASKLPGEAPPIVYPDSDGLPMADNTLQYQWIVTIQGNLDARVPDFVAGDLLWYPVEGNPKLRTAPDTLVAFGRPKGYRGSYRQWEEGGIAPQVVFEILSPGNRPSELIRKFAFYDRYGVEELYVFDPDHVILEAWVRSPGGGLAQVEDTQGFVSPRLGIRFQLDRDLEIFDAHGERFLTFAELMDRARHEKRRADDEKQRADELAARLRALGVDVP